jgi:drug/metabolite transporter (DMT)-like permease
MSERMTWRERAVWLGVVAVLASSLGWLAMLSAIALVHAHAVPWPALAVVRALVRSLAALVLHAWPLLPLAALGGMILTLAVGGTATLRRKVGHV